MFTSPCQQWHHNSWAREKAPNYLLLTSGDRNLFSAPNFYYTHTGHPSKNRDSLPFRESSGKKLRLRKITIFMLSVPPVSLRRESILSRTKRGFVVYYLGNVGQRTRQLTWSAFIYIPAMCCDFHPCSFIWGCSFIKLPKLP